MRSARGFAGVILAIGLLVAACGASSAGQNPSGLGSGTNPVATGSGGGLAPGLASNLDALTSYQFTESMADQGSAGSGQPVPSADGEVGISGTVVNRPTRSLSISAGGALYVIVGSQAWTSLDGTSWTAMDPTTSTLTDFLPAGFYATWFDAYAAGFKVAGDESKNGVQCVHYKGDSSLGSLYQGAAGASASFQADLWVAKDGNYPVSGVYGFSASSGSQGAGFGYSFDITHVNDPSNTVAPPTDVLAIPT